jgi:hypothetical protein
VFLVVIGHFEAPLLEGGSVMKSRIAVIPASNHLSNKLRMISDSLVKEFNSAGHSAFLVRADETGLSTYDFLVICSEPVGMGSKLGVKIADLLGGSSLIGKRCSAVMVKSGLLPLKALSRLMAALESEGLVVTMGEVVSDTKHAVEIARNTPVIRG